MNTLTLSSARVGQIGLILAALVAASCAADDFTSPQSAASLPDPGGANAASQYTLDLEDGSGHPFQLVYQAGQGWTHVAATAEGGRAAVEKVNYQREDTSKAAEPAGEIMSVFIDGPTGYTYTWSSEKGWKFVGHIKGH